MMTVNDSECYAGGNDLSSCVSANHIVLHGISPAGSTISELVGR